MKKNKGFTLIELLGTIIVLGIIIGIALPAISNFIKKGKTKYYNSLEKTIEASARDYLEDYRALLPRGEVGNITVILGDELLVNNYIDKILDSDGNPCEAKVAAKKIGTNEFEYYTCLKCKKIEGTDDYEYESDVEACEYTEHSQEENKYIDSSEYTIEININDILDIYEYLVDENGIYTIIVPQGSEFNLPTATVKRNDLELSVKVVPTPSKVNTNILGDTLVKYIYHGVETKLIVRIVDKTAPQKPEVVLRKGSNQGDIYANGWSSKDIYHIITATDYTKPGVLGSGIKRFDISTNGTTWSPLEGNTYLTNQDGIYKYYLRAVDNNNNVSEILEYEVRIDKASPELEIRLTGTMGENNWYISDVKVENIISDSVSDLFQTGMTITGENSKVLGISINNLNERLQDKGILTATLTKNTPQDTITSTLTDLAGNGVTANKTVKIDKDKPTLSITSVTPTSTTATYKYTTTSLSGTDNVVLEYGTSTNYGSSINCNNGTCNLTGLKINTKYYYKLTVTSKAGNKNAISDVVNTTKCEVGTYGPTGTYTCNQCALSYTTDFGAESDTQCYINVGAGKHKTSSTADSLTSCETGTYVGEHRSYYKSEDKCSSCPSGYTSDTGSTNINSCFITVADGKYKTSTTGTTLNACAAGTFSTSHRSYYNSSDSCSSCGAGTFASGTGNSKCTSCSTGTYTNAQGKASCTTCASGTYNTGTGNTGCTTCEKGYFCTGGSAKTACSTLGSGYTSDAGAKVNTSCYINLAAGQYKSANGTATACAAGTYYGSARTAYYGTAYNCSSCASGNYTDKGNNTGATKCTTCPIGSSCNGKTATTCAAGTYTNAQGKASCTTCEAGYFCTGGSARSACSGLGSGYTSAAGAKVNTSCYISLTAGQYKTANGTAASCGAGTYYGSARTAYYGTAYNCNTCAAGTYNSGNGNTGCTTCEAGYYCTGGSNHTSCGGGKTSPAGSSAASQCYALSYAAITSEKVDGLEYGNGYNHEHWEDDGWAYRGYITCWDGTTCMNYENTTITVPYQTNGNGTYYDSCSRAYTCPPQPVKVCPTGTTEISGSCYSCPNGGTLNTSTRMCEF